MENEIYFMELWANNNNYSEWIEPEKIFLLQDALSNTIIYGCKTIAILKIKLKNNDTNKTI